MGLGQNTGTITFVNISKGRLIIKKDGVVSEFGYVEGHLIGIEIQDAEYQGDKYKRLSLKINDGTQSYILQMRLDSGYGRAFCCAIPNANLSLPIKISPSFKDDRGGLFLNQNGHALKWFFTKDNPNGLPQMKPVEVRGKTVWDNSDQQEFFVRMIERLKTKLVPELLAGPAAPTDQPHSDMPPDMAPSTQDIQQVVDDLPF